MHHGGTENTEKLFPDRLLAGSIIGSIQGEDVPSHSVMPGQFEVMIERDFSSAHQLRGYKGKCENLHGHNYRVEIYARGRELNNIGLLVDFVELKEAADDLVT